MITTVEVRSWEAYCSAVDELRQEYNSVPVLFRGQSNSSWGLRTTLERYSKSCWTVRQYCSLVIDCIRDVRSFADYPDDVPSLSDIDRELSENMNQVLVRVPASISFYWTFLRHYGFPSPLLDWTVSPYIAAFFALCEGTDAESAAVFAFIDAVGSEKHAWPGKPQITAKWLNVHQHARHKRQQSCYTIATEAVKRDHRFAPHEHVFRENESGQDVLVKYAIPSGESTKALKWLDAKGINHYSLMADREAYFKALALKKIRFEGL
ncbi:MAG TPA: FRG domain-containing protein [Syntrophales bacterium]|nr:FRG domain-containing protein [Syntrophales bacterium]